MKCTNPQLGKFALLSGEEPDEQLSDSVQEHLTSCAYCAEKRRRYFDWRNLLRAEPESHISTEVLIAYHDMNLTSAARDRTKQHLAKCERCSEKVARFEAAFESLAKEETLSDSIPGWTVEREKSFVARMKTELAARGQIEQERDAFVGQAVSRPPVRQRRFLRYAFALILGLVALIISADVARYFYLKNEREKLDENKNLIIGESHGFPSPSARESPENDLTVRHPIQQSTPPKTLPSPESPSSADTQEVALVVDPTRGPSTRTEISLSKPFVRFSVSIKGEATNRSFRVEMIDEEIGKRVVPISTLKALVSPHERRVSFLVNAKDMLHTFYTLRLTALSTSGGSAEIFTVYLKATK
jgi:hypothetical protein